jgi:hypothetical protein
MATFAERTELELRHLKFGASSKDWVAFSEVQQHGQEEGIALQGCSHSLALQSGAEPVCRLFRRQLRSRHQPWSVWPAGALGTSVAR